MSEMDMVADRELKRKRETLENLSQGDVIRYPANVYWDERPDTYLIVYRVENGRIYGKIATSHSVSAISIDKLLEKDPKILKADWKEI